MVGGSASSRRSRAAAAKPGRVWSSEGWSRTRSSATSRLCTTPAPRRHLSRSGAEAPPATNHAPVPAGLRTRHHKPPPAGPRALAGQPTTPLWVQTPRWTRWACGRCPWGTGQSAPPQPHRTGTVPGEADDQGPAGVGCRRPAQSPALRDQACGRPGPEVNARQKAQLSALQVPLGAQARHETPSQGSPQAPPLGRGREPAAGWGTHGWPMVYVIATPSGWERKWLRCCRGRRSELGSSLSRSC